jgi:hypothetical protein
MPGSAFADTDEGPLMPHHRHQQNCRFTYRYHGICNALHRAIILPQWCPAFS